MQGKEKKTDDCDVNSLPPPQIEARNSRSETVQKIVAKDILIVMMLCSFHSKATENTDSDWLE